MRQIHVKSAPEIKINRSSSPHLAICNVQSAELLRRSLNIASGGKGGNGSEFRFASHFMSMIVHFKVGQNLRESQMIDLLEVEENVHLLYRFL